MKVYKVCGTISSFWKGETEEYTWSDLFKYKSKAENEKLKLKNHYNNKNGYNSKFWVVEIDVIE